MGQNSREKHKGRELPEIVESHYCLLESAESTGVKDKFEWMWRKYYVGMYGTLTVYKCKDYPNKYICLLQDWQGEYLRTGRGDLTRVDNKIIIHTKNSVYTFVICERKTRRPKPTSDVQSVGSQDKSTT